MRLLAKEETPSDWISKKIGFYVLGHKGGAALRPNDFSNTGFPVIPKKAIQPTGELLIENPTYCTNEFASNNKRSIVDSSYAITTLRDLVPTGPTIGTVVNFSNEEKYILSQGVYGLKLNDALDKHYLSYLSNTAFYRKVMQRIMVGSTQVHIRTPEYLDLEIQIPPLPEQQKIAKILSTWDKAISTTERLIDNSTQQKKALMQQLLTGKKRLLDESGKRFDGEWEERKLSNLGSTFNGLTGKTKVDFGSGKKYIPYMNIFKNTFIDTDNLDYVNIDVDEKQNTVQFGDVFFTTSSETPEEVGMSSILLKKTKEPIYLNSFCFGFRLFEIDKVAPAFIGYILRSSHVRRKIAILAQGATRYNLSKVQLLKISIALPSLEEQQKIATVLTNADREIELLEQQLADLQQEKKALMQVLLTGKKRVVVDGES